MSGYIGNTLDNNTPTDKDKNVLTLIFGEKTCVDDPLTKIFWYVGLAVAAAIVFLVLNCSYFNSCLDLYPDPQIQLALKVGLFFILIFILDFLFLNWRKQTPLCSNCLEISQI